MRRVKRLGDLSMLYCSFASIPMMYPACFTFSTPSSAFVTLSGLNLFIGVITTVTTFVLEVMPDDEELTRIGLILKQVFLIFPHYCLGRGLMDMAAQRNMNRFLKTFGSSFSITCFIRRVFFYRSLLGYKVVRSRFQWDFLGQFMASMLVQGIVWFFITLAIEYRLWSYLSCANKCQNFSHDSLDQDPSEEMDEDVAKEMEKVLSRSSSLDVLQVRRLFKK